LITKALTLPRQDILREFRIDWVEGTAESFAVEVLPELAKERTRGFAFIGEYSGVQNVDFIPLVSQLASERPQFQTEYLLGEEPDWSDLVGGRAIERSHDKVLLDLALEILDGKRRETALAVTGTAGTGKSTALMSLALRLSNSGIPVLWLDKDSKVTPLKIRKKVRNGTGRLVLAIDDGDLYGRELVELLKDLIPGTTEFLFVFAVRSSKLDEITAPIGASSSLHVLEHVVPPLTDDDIDGLIDVLDRYRRLGRLTGANAVERRRAFSEQAGRQMLVAMIQATSNENFENKACGELTELTAAQHFVYSIVCVASALRYYLTKDEILLACGASYSDALLALDRLAARHLITVRPPAYRYRARHRVIADIIWNKLVELKEFKACIEGLVWAIGSKANPSADRRSRLFEFLADLINHSTLRRIIGVMDARDVYEELESILNWDYHYWLQRGSLEVEAGDIRLAENFLNSAQSLASGDYRVRTAYGYMLMRKAWEAPAKLHAQEVLNAGVNALEEVLEDWGRLSAYPYHVLGSQGLAWAHRASLTPQEKRTFLEIILSSVKGGVERHPRSDDLQRLQQDIKKEILLTVTVPPKEKHHVG
jgi:hypothetical protein